MADKITIDKKGSNYAVINNNGKMVAQVMKGGMFGKGNVVVIDNHGNCTFVKNPQHCNAVLNEVIKKAG
jgi:hypothetical protein